MKNHYVYEITNKINNKKYIGKRSCNCDIKEDTYMGSGKYLWNAYKKYGLNNFQKEVLKICDTEQEALEYEKKLISKLNATRSSDYYNIAEGGQGGNAIAGFTEEEMKAYKIKLSKSGKKSRKKIVVVLPNNNVERFESEKEAVKKYGSPIRVCIWTGEPYNPRGGSRKYKELIGLKAFFE